TPGRDCAEAVVEWLRRLARMAVLTHNLTALVVDYRRTERRARAIEDVLLPENEQRIHELEDRLEDVDQEEAIRVRLSQSID
ncbi:MAG TPA: V-type ATP synthase subunit D, partial [Thiohalobacter sp.]|nr:V-type ATP synthase subunit D [Thiohalobacter sp.]